jgi:hypothetical protein
MAVFFIRLCCTSHKLHEAEDVTTLLKDVTYDEFILIYLRAVVECDLFMEVA